MDDQHFVVERERLSQASTITATRDASTEEEIFEFLEIGEGRASQGHAGAWVMGAFLVALVASLTLVFLPRGSDIASADALARAMTAPATTDQAAVRRQG